MQWRKISKLILIGFVALLTAIRAIEDDDDEFNDVVARTTLKIDTRTIDGVNVMDDPESPSVSDSVTDKTSPSPERGVIIEIIGMIFLCIYGVVFTIGKQKNEQLAKSWFDIYQSFFMAQFSAVGIHQQTILNEQSEPTDPPILIKESSNHYKFYCSGRRHCIGMLIELELVSRQDLFSLIRYLIYPQEDIMSVSIAMKPDEMDPFIFSVFRKEQYALVAKKFAELKLANKVKSELLCEQVIYTDALELVPNLLTKVVQKALKNHADVFQFMIFTDQNSKQIEGLPKDHRHLLHFQMKIPQSSKKMQEMQQMLEMVMYFVDIVEKAGKLSREARKKAEQKRKNYEEELSKSSQEDKAQDLLDQRRAEKTMKERDHYASLTYEQQQKYDEAKEKKMQRKRLSKMKTKHK